MANQLIPLTQVADELVKSINDATRDLNEHDKRQFVKGFCEWLYRINGFPPEAPRDN